MDTVVAQAAKWRFMLGGDAQDTPGGGGACIPLLALALSRTRTLARTLARILARTLARTLARNLTLALTLV